jgi:hypothetical protein
MSEIDRRRAVADTVIYNARCAQGAGTVRFESWTLRIEAAEDRVLEALREWWAQGCREIQP